MKRDYLLNLHQLIYFFFFDIGIEDQVAISLMCKRFHNFILQIHSSSSGNISLKYFAVHFLVKRIKHKKKQFERRYRT